MNFDRRIIHTELENSFNVNKLLKHKSLLNFYYIFLPLLGYTNVASAPNEEKTMSKTFPRCWKGKIIQVDEFLRIS